MILMAEDADGKLMFMEPSSVVKNGSEVRQRRGKRSFANN